MLVHLLPLALCRCSAVFPLHIFPNEPTLLLWSVVDTPSSKVPNSAAFPPTVIKPKYVVHISLKAPKSWTHVLLGMVSYVFPSFPTSTTKALNLLTIASCLSSSTTSVTTLDLSTVYHGVPWKLSPPFRKIVDG